MRWAELRRSFGMLAQNGMLELRGYYPECNVSIPFSCPLFEICTILQSSTEIPFNEVNFKKRVQQNFTVRALVVAARMISMASGLAGRLAVVTGGGSGIGKAVCQLFAKHGASIAVVDINSKNAEETAKSLTQNTDTTAKHTSFAVDISSYDAVGELVKNVAQTYGAAPCVLVNSAGITKDDFLLNLEEEKFDDVISVNLKVSGGSGIGKAVCQLFAKHGASIAVVDINSKNAEETAKSLTQNTDTTAKHTSFAVDISSYDAVGELVKNVAQTYGAAPCVLVNSAGITKDDFLLNLEEEKFDDVISVNLKGTFLMTQAVGRAMAQAKVKNGTMVNIASISGKVGNIGQCNYAASKAGVEGFTRTAAKELAKFGIRCNVVLPGFIDTPMTEAVPDKVLDKFRGAIPLGRLGQPEDVADVCLFLASQQSSYITGASIDVTGGLFM